MKGPRRKSFEQNVQRKKKCWEWVGSLDKDGYGRTHKYITGVRKTVRAHRVAWEREFGPIPTGLCVLHQCDNPCCVRPSHLFLGTVGDNNRDMHDKGRGFFQSESNPAKLGAFQGSKNGRACITEQQVREIRRLYMAGVASYRVLAIRFNVSKGIVANVVTRKTWAHV